MQIKWSFDADPVIFYSQEWNSFHSSPEWIHLDKSSDEF